METNRLLIRPMQESDQDAFQKGLPTRYYKFGFVKETKHAF